MHIILLPLILGMLTIGPFELLWELVEKIAGLF